MPRVLILCEYGSLNGGERSLLAVLDDVRAAGFDVTVAAPPAGPLAEAAHGRGIPLVPLRLHDASGRRVSLGACRQLVRGAVDRAGPDLIHANSLSMGRLAGPVAAELGIPSLGHLRDIVRLNRAAAIDLSRNRRLVAVSQATRDWYLQARLSAEKIFVLYNGVDLRRFQPRPATGYLHRELNIPADAPLVGSIGQIGIRKGLHALAQAAPMVLTAVPATHFVVVGRRYSDKPEARQYERDLRQMTAVEPLAGRFHFLGLRDDVERLLNEFHVLAHAARQEPLGRVLLEAAASGTPVVATDVGGTREIFPADAQAAILVPVDAPETMAQAIVGLLHDPARRCVLRGAARQRAESAFDAHRSAERLVTHYRDVLGGGGAGG
jgi:glycosyltransferase involved in cell wall biosynthesis